MSGRYIIYSKQLITLQFFFVLLHREDTMDNFGRFVRSLDDSLRHLYCVGDANAKRHEDCKSTSVLILRDLKGNSLVICLTLMPNNVLVHYMCGVSINVTT